MVAVELLVFSGGGCRRVYARRAREVGLATGSQCAVVVERTLSMSAVAEWEYLFSLLVRSASQSRRTPPFSRLVE